MGVFPLLTVGHVVTRPDPRMGGRGWVDALWDVGQIAAWGGDRVDPVRKRQLLHEATGNTRDVCLVARCKHWNTEKGMYEDHLPTGDTPSQVAYLLVCTHKRDGFDADGRDALLENAKAALVVWGALAEDAIRKQPVMDLFQRLAKLKEGDRLLLSGLVDEWERRLQSTLESKGRKQSNETIFEEYLEKYNSTEVLLTNVGFQDFMKAVPSQQASLFIRCLRCIDLFHPHFAFVLVDRQSDGPCEALFEAMSTHLVEELCTCSELHVRMFQKLFDDLYVQGTRQKKKGGLEALSDELGKLDTLSKESLYLLAEDLLHIAAITIPQYMGHIALGMCLVIQGAKRQDIYGELKPRMTSFLDELAGRDLKAALKVYFCICSSSLARDVSAHTSEILSYVSASQSVPWATVFPSEQSMDVDPAQESAGEESMLELRDAVGPYR